MTRSRSQAVFLALSLISLLLAGCRSSAETGLKATATVSEQLEVKTPTPDKTDGVSGLDNTPTVDPSTATGAVDQEPGASLPPSFTAMLASLGDRRMEVNLSFEGQDAAGVPLAFAMTSVETVAVSPPGSRLDLSADDGGAPGQAGAISLLRFDDVTYLYLPQIGCISGSADEFEDDMKLPLDPRDLLEGLSDAQMVANNVLVNGLGTAEFRFDETSLPWSSGSLWTVDGLAFVEEGSDFVTRVVMTLNGSGDLLGDGRVLDGEYDIAIDITPVAGNEAIIIPDACQESARYPVPPDAFEVTVIEDLLAYKSLLSLDEVVDFYMEQMPEAGWQSSSEPEMFDDLAIMNFEQGGTPLMITVEYDTDSETVSVLVSP